MSLEERLRGLYREDLLEPIPADFLGRVLSELPARRRERLPAMKAAVLALSGLVAAGLLAFGVPVVLRAPTASPPASTPAAGTPPAAGSPPAAGTPPAAAATGSTAPRPRAEPSGVVAATPGAYISHSTDPLSVLVQLRPVRGSRVLTPPSGSALLWRVRGPIFTLYGDGTAIYAAGRERFPPRGRPLRLARLSEAQVQALLRLGRDAIGQLSSKPRGDGSSYLFATSYELEYHAGGIDHVGLHLGPPRAAVTDLGPLRNFGAEVAAGRATDGGPYLPQAWRPYLLHQPGRVTGTSAVPWPWPAGAWPRGPLDFFPAPDGTRTLEITPEEAAALPNQVRAGTVALARAPDGQRYYLAARPLLPDEVAALDPTWRVHNPEHEAIQLLIRSEGTRCMEAAEISMVAPARERLDELINQAGGTERFVPGSLIWIGEPKALASVAGITYIGRQGGSLWIVVLDSAPFAQELRQFTASGGVSVWWPANVARPRACGPQR